MQNTGFGVSEYSFVIPEVGMSGLPPVEGPLVNYEMVWKKKAQFRFE